MLPGVHRPIHYMLGEPGWEHVADYALRWAMDHALQDLCKFTRARPSCGPPARFTIGSASLARARPEMHDMTKRRRARLVAEISPVTRAGPIWLPNRRRPHHKLVPARLGPLPAGCST